MKNTLETRLGIFFALALVVAIIILEMVGAADFFTPGYQVKASFKNVQELKRGDPVKIAGVEVGRVEDIKLIEARALVVMKINGKYDIPTDAKAIIKFTGLMGQNYVAVEGGTSKNIVVHSKTEGTTLDSEEQPDLSAIMTKLQNVANNVEGMTKSFSTENFSTLLGPIMNVFTDNRTNISTILSNTATVTHDIAAGQGTVGKLIKDPALYNAAFNAVTNLQAASGDLKGVMAQASGMVGNANALMGTAKVIVDEVNAGQGTVGKLLKDPTLFYQMTNTMGNMAEIMEKVNRGTGSVARVINDQDLYKNARLGLQKLEKATEGLEDQGPLSVLGILVNSLF